MKYEDYNFAFTADGSFKLVPVDTGTWQRGK